MAGKPRDLALALPAPFSSALDVANNIEKTSDIAKETEKMSGDVMLEVNKLLGITENLKNFSFASNARKRSGIVRVW